MGVRDQVGLLWSTHLGCEPTLLQPACTKKSVSSRVVRVCYRAFPASHIREFHIVIIGCKQGTSPEDAQCKHWPLYRPGHWVRCPKTARYRGQLRLDSRANVPVNIYHDEALVHRGRFITGHGCNECCFIWSPVRARTTRLGVALIKGTSDRKEMRRRSTLLQVLRPFT